jgi:hypothetical protein
MKIIPEADMKAIATVPPDGSGKPQVERGMSGRRAMNQDDLEFSDIGRDPRFTVGGWLGLGLIAAVVLCVIYAGFKSVWPALALAVFT